MEVICNYCGKKFDKLPNQIKRSKKHFCSPECRRLSTRKSNNVIQDGKITYLLYEGKNKKFQIIIDTEDYLKIKDKYWIVNSKGYAKCQLDKLFLHRFLMNCPDNKFVDHINRNPLDNRKSNLRICTHSQNCINRGLTKYNKSGHKGVYFCATLNRWQANIKINGENINLGRFKDKDEAIKVRKEAEIKYGFNQWD